MWSALLVMVSVPALIAIAVSFVPVPPVPVPDPPRGAETSAATPSTRRFARCAVPAPATVSEQPLGETV